MRYVLSAMSGRSLQITVDGDSLLVRAAEPLATALALAGLSRGCARARRTRRGARRLLPYGRVPGMRAATLTACCGKPASLRVRAGMKVELRGACP